MTSDSTAKDPRPDHDDLWDAGDLGCGELVTELRNRLRAMPGKVLKLIARDPGAPADIPAYCHMTGHELIHSDPASSSYWIRARTYSLPAGR